MNIFKIFSSFFIFILISGNFYGQDICTNYTATPGTTISGSGTNTYNTTINVPDSYTITDVNVTVNISHTRNRDLYFYIISPTGTIITLSTYKGGNGDNYSNVTFDDASSNTLPTGNTTLSGSYQPEGSLASFNGQNSNGNWILRITDTANGQGGTINNLNINLCYTPIPVSGYLGPGGVGHSDGSSNLKLWLDASKGTTLAGSNLTNWSDQSGNGNSAISPSLAASPLLASSDVNGYPSLNFDGINDELRVAHNTNLNLTKWDIFVVTKANVNKDYNAIMAKGVDSQENYEFLTYGTGDFHTPLYFTDGSRTFANSSTGLYSTTNFDLFEYSFSSAAGRDVYKNNTSIITDNDNKTPQTNNQSLYIGNENGTTNRFLNGRISELFIFNTPLNNAQRIIINNYLSAKYNQTLANNDIYSHDDFGNGDFDHNVAGIGQASDGSSHFDSQGTGIVRISNPTITGDNRFLFWGEETKNPTYNFSTNTTNFTEQLNSRWRVSRQGNLGRVTVSFDISSMNLTGKQSCSPLQLVVDNNYDFSSPTDIYDLTIVGNTATATGVLLQNNRYFTLRYTDQIVWNGSNFYNGSGSGNAPDNTNACLKLTVKSGATANITFNAHVREVEIETGANLNVANGILLETENNVVINGTINLIGEAQLIQNHTGTSSNSGSGSLKIRQQGTSNLFNYNYWSSPVNRSGFWRIGYLEDTVGIVNFISGINANASTSPITLSSRWLYRFKGPIGDYNSWARLSTSSNIAPGIGYTMKGSGTLATEQEFIFRGIPNDGNYMLPVTANTDILVGNPYPSTLDANQFINDNLSVIDGSLYFWESFSSNNSHYLAEYEGGYAIYNLMMPLAAVADASGLTSGNGTALKPAPTRYVNIGQGFFTTITNSGTLIFNNAQRAFARESLNQTVYFKTNSKSKQTVVTDERPKVWFSFTEPKGYTKMIGLGYDEKASYGYDKGYDAKQYNDFKNDFYWFLNDEKLVIQALPEINTEDKLPLNVKISDAGFYTFSIDKMENIPHDLNIYLVDNIQNTYYNLRDGDAQLFLNSVTKANQFSIAFKNENVLRNTSFEVEKIHTSYDVTNKNLALHTKESLENFKSFKIYNVVGQEVLNVNSPNSYKINLSHLTDGVYFLKVNSKTIEAIKSIKFLKY